MDSDRRAFVRSVILSAMGLPFLAACDDKVGKTRYGPIPPLKAASSSIETIHLLLEELRGAYEARSMHVTKSLLPGISPANLAAKCKWFPAELPAEIFALYSWHNGQENDPWNEEFPFWFRDNGFTSIENAEQEYKSMMQSYGQQLPPSQIGVDLKYCFPFAAFNGGWYVFPCNGQAISLKTNRPVISVFQAVDLIYNSVESMIRTSIAWVKDPLYSQKGSKITEEGWLHIWEKNNPGIRQHYD